MVIDLILSGKKLSREDPAEKFIEEDKIDLFFRDLKEIKQQSTVAFYLRDTPVYNRGPPVLVASETTVTLSPEEAAQQATWFEENGADIVIVGVPLEEDYHKSIERIKAIEKKLSKAVLAIDAINPNIIKKGFELGADLAFSLHEGNIQYFEKFRRDKAFVVIPGNPYKGKTPRNEAQALRMLLKNVSRAKEKGYEKLLADLILPPPCTGFVNIITAYRKLDKKLPDTPMMAGLANITELIDVDSHGVNTLLSVISVELGLSMVLVSEESWKARYSTLETKLSLALSSVARKRRSPPVGVGVDLILLKEKNKPSSSNLWLTAKDTINVDEIEKETTVLDEWGYVVIEVDYTEKKIVVCLHRYKDKIPYVCYRGREPHVLLKRILKDNPQFSLYHAGYLGREIERAWISLILGKQYEQDKSLFKEKIDKIRKIIQKISDI